QPDDYISDRLKELRSKGILFGSVGRLSQEKGYDLLLEAFSRVKRHHNDCVLAIMGDGKLKADLQKLAVKLGIASEIEFFGYVEDAGSYIQFFDFYINSSHTEGLPITLLEAMRCG